MNIDKIAALLHMELVFPLSVQNYRDIILNVPKTNPAAFVMGVVCIAWIWITKEYINPPVKKAIKIPIPIDLFVVGEG